MPRNGFKPSLIYLKGYNRLKNQQSNQINISSVPLLFALRLDSNVVFFTSIFISLQLYSVWRRLGWSADPRQTLGSLLPDRVPPRGLDPSVVGERRRLCTRVDRPTNRCGPSNSTERRTCSCHRSRTVHALHREYRRRYTSQ
jgi:hypothetical protein